MSSPFSSFFFPSALESPLFLTNSSYTSSQLDVLLGTALSKGLLLEVSATPKPGLVDKEDSGSHSDMNYSLFLQSIRALHPWFIRIARAGRTFQGPLSKLLDHLRPLGKKAEQAMFTATRGINTHKGVIFSGSILIATLNYLLERKTSFSFAQLFSAIAEVSRPSLKDFSRLTAFLPVTSLSSHEQVSLSSSFSSRSNSSFHLTAGEQAYLSYGSLGIRGECSNGLPSVQYAFPAFLKAISAGKTEEDALLHALIHIMAVLEDTVILKRGGPVSLSFVQHLARQLVAKGGIFSPAFISELRNLNTLFTRRNLSPGGAADMAALCGTLYYVLNSLT